MLQRCLKIPAAEAHPVSADEFRTLYAGLLAKIPSLRDKLTSKKIGIAVSGGSDSLALALLATQVIPPERLVALTVDHGLGGRGVTEDPEAVKDTVKRLGIRHHHIVSLDWKDILRESMNKGKLMEKTRELRYEALLQACRRFDVPLLLTGHNLDDDLVTMFYRMAHQSGNDGLAGMKAGTTFPVVDKQAAGRFFVGRPLLEVPKGRLEATCKAASLDISQDASNNDMDFRRNCILTSLRQVQESDESLSTSSLQRMLGNMKRVRADLQDELLAIFERSVVINKLNGDATLILNEASWLERRPIATRLLTLLIQFAGNNRYPARTASVNALYEALLEAFKAHVKEQRAWRAKLPLPAAASELQPIDKTKRLAALKQHVLGGCTFYGLSRVDAMRRIALQERLEGRKLEYGPAFLVQRDPPGRIHTHQAKLHPSDVTLGPGETFLWDNRIYCSFEHGLPLLSSPTPPSGARSFTISFMTPGDVKDFEALTKAMPAARRRVYAYLATTPGTHLYQIPVVREIGTEYMAFPTLQADYPIGKYKWKTSCAGLTVLTSRFVCLP